MTQREVKKADNRELIAELAISYAALTVNKITGGATKRITSHCEDVEAELCRRGLFTLKQVRELNV